MHAVHIPEECFKEVSIDFSCTGALDEESPALCSSDQRPDAQLSAWIAMTVLAATVVALVAVGAVLVVRQIRQ